MEIEKTRITYIYALMGGDNVRYVGKSDDPNKRLNEHIKYDYNKKSYKHNWVRKMLRENKEINFKILEVVPYNIWGEREIYWTERKTHSSPLAWVGCKRLTLIENILTNSIRRSLTD